jgi:hypothetical protein
MEILNYRTETRGSVIASFDIYFPKMSLTLRNYRLLRSGKTGGMYISPPAFGKDNGDPSGKKEWIPYIEWSKEKGVELQKQVLELLKPFTESSEQQASPF